MMPFPESFPVPLIYIEETDSTNHYLNDLCNKQDVSELTTVVANYQTLGRGQRGNSWESEKGKNLMFSFVLYPTSLEIRRQFLLSQIISLSIKEELDTYVKDISIKWPNDVYWKERKICGILIENDLMGVHISQTRLYCLLKCLFSCRYLMLRGWCSMISLRSILRSICV